MKIQTKNIIAVGAVVLVAVATAWGVRHFHRPGQLDVISAQAMDMSAVRPPTGAAPVALVTVRTGSVSDTVTYTGSVAAYNEQDITPRIAGTILSLPVYPGDRVRAGQLLAQLDSAEVSAQSDQAMAQVREAQINVKVAHLTHQVHHAAALAQSDAQVAAAQQAVRDAEAQAQASQDAVVDSQSSVQSAMANAAYWKTEIAREKQLADAGAASQQEYQNELAQAQTAFAAVDQANAKVSEAKATVRSNHAKVQEAERQVDAANAGEQMSQADLIVAEGQAEQAGAGESAAEATARQADVVQGYTRIVSPSDGVVIERPVAPGTLVQPGVVILKIAEIDTVRVQAHVAVTDLTGIRAGSPVNIATQDGGAPIDATVNAVFPSADTDTRTAIVEALVPNADHRLLPGSFVTMKIARPATADKMLVPAGAVISSEGQSFVWIARGVTAAAGSTYECSVCHMHYSAAQAERLHFRDPMDGGILTPIAAAPPSGPLTAHQVTVETGASDGAWTAVVSSDLKPGDRVVAHGQAGLMEGAQIVETAWGPDGPKSLPTAASANAGLTLYRCEKCGMTYSEADARKNHFVDPMDGGRLIAVTSGQGSANR